ncbi:MAG: hypothetical protein Alpg2KO_06120 [Alphaproteobacteria bacterium]
MTHMPNPRVHIVEDDPAVIDGLCLLVTACGHTVFAWPDAETFLEMAEIAHGDHVLVDIDLPGISGATLCRWLADRPESPNLIAMSGLPANVLKPILAKLPTRTFLRKPLVIDDLEAALSDRQAP